MSTVHIYTPVRLRVSQSAGIARSARRSIARSASPAPRALSPTPTQSSTTAPASRAVSRGTDKCDHKLIYDPIR